MAVFAGIGIWSFTETGDDSKLDLDMEASGSAASMNGPQNTTSPEPSAEPSPPILESPAMLLGSRSETGIFLPGSAAATNTAAPGENGNGAEEPEDYPQKGLLVWIDRNDEGYSPGSGQGLAISGRVTDPWGNGIAGAYVRMFEVLQDGSLKEYLPPDAVCLSLTCPPAANPRTDTDGYFSVNMDSPGSYKLFFTGTLTGPNFLQWVTEEWYNNRNTAEEATAVPVGSSGLDVVLVPSTSISGNINLTYYCAGPSQYACRANPPAVQVAAYRADRPELVSLATVTSFIDPHFENYHHFHFNSLPAGEYKLLVTPDYSDTTFSYGDTEYIPTWFHRADSWQTAVKIQVQGGQSVTVENFALLTRNRATVAVASSGPAETGDAAAGNGAPGASPLPPNNTEKAPSPASARPGESTGGLPAETPAEVAEPLATAKSASQQSPAADSLNP